MYPFYWTSSERGIFMRYSYEFKRKAVELYRQGKWIEPPADITNLKNFHDMIVKWHHLEKANSPDCLKHHGKNKKWAPEEKYELVAQVIAGATISSVAYDVGINTGLLAQWIRKYKIWGYNGLVDRKKGRKPKEPTMEKMNINNPHELEESEYEELIRLRAENAYIKAGKSLVEENIVMVEGRLSIREDDRTTIIANDIKDFGEQKQRILTINITDATEEEKDKLRGFLRYFCGDRNNINVQIQVGEECKPCGQIYLTDEILKVLKEIVGEEKVSL